MFSFSFTGHGSYLTLYTPDDEGNLQLIVEVNVFGYIRQLNTLRLPGEAKDYIIVGSSSGCLIILEYNHSLKRFDQVHNESFGKTGVRRIVPGEYLVVDPQGRSIMIAAVEKQKFVYVTNRDTAARLTISSPLEAHKNSIITFDLISLDVNYDNPLFAALEVNYEDNEDNSKMINFYELDLGLNHVVKKKTIKVDSKTSHLISLPSGEIGPGGLLCCSNKEISYINIDHETLTCSIPQRLSPNLVTENEDQKTEEAIIVTSALLGQKGLMFILIQNELGDLFRISLTLDENNLSKVIKLEIEYFDTLPVCRFLIITRKGLLFCCFETGDLKLYQIFDSEAPERNIQGPKTSSSSDEQQNEVTVFVPRALAKLRYLDKIVCYSPSTFLLTSSPSSLELNSTSDNMGVRNGESSEIFLLNGKGSNSRLSILKNGLSCVNVAKTKLPGRPLKVFTIKETKEDELDKYILISFINVSLILSISSNVKQIKNTFLITNLQTVDINLLSDNSVVQIHSKGLRHLKKLVSNSEISDEKEKEVKERDDIYDWSSGERKVLSGCICLRQVFIILDDSSLIYFELDEVNNLNLVSKIENTSISSENGQFSNKPSCIDYFLLQGELKTKLIAIGYHNKILRLYKLSDADNTTFEEVGLQVLPDIPYSLCFNNETKIPLLCIGLVNGILIRTKINNSTGKLYETKSNYLGNTKVILNKIFINQKLAISCLSSRSWILSSLDSRSSLEVLNYEELYYLSNFTNDECEGFIGITKNSLNIFYLKNKNISINNNKFKTNKNISLNYTPRKIIKNPINSDLYFILETELNSPNFKEIKQIVEIQNQQRKKIFGEKEPLMEMENDEDEEMENGEEKMEEEDDDEEDDDDEEEKEEMKLTFKQVGYPKLYNSSSQSSDEPKQQSERWLSLIKAINPKTEEILSTLEMDENEFCSSLLTTKFHLRPKESFLVLGTCKNFSFYSGSSATTSENTTSAEKEYFIKIYKIQKETELSLINKTQVFDLPKAMCSTPDGRLIVCLGQSLCLYDLSASATHLLKKSHFRKAISSKALEVKIFMKQGGERDYIGDDIFDLNKRMKECRIFIADLKESIICYKYFIGKSGNESFGLLCDDIFPRAITDFEVLDYDSLCAADKFGNIFILRIPDQLDEAYDTTIRMKLSAQGQLDGAPNKFVQVCCFHVGEMITSVRRVKLAPGRPEILLYVTIQGTLGCLVPYKSRSDAEFFMNFENIIRQTKVDIVGREHLDYRSTYIPCQRVVDGDLLNEFYELGPEKQKSIADSVDRTVGEIINKVEELYMRLI